MKKIMEMTSKNFLEINNIRKYALKTVFKNIIKNDNPFGMLDRYVLEQVFYNSLIELEFVLKN
jgi:hypothetical protein